MCVGRQIKVFGSYWKGRRLARMSNEEVNAQYKFTVREYHVFHSGIQVAHPLKQ